MKKKQSHSEKNFDIATPCCIAGGGPAGMMLGYLLARAGVPVTILEKHADFLRDFRGDTVHPSTLEILDQADLLETFNQLPQSRVDHLSVRIGDRVQQMVDFRGLKPFDYLALVPQWDFLDMIADAGQRYPHFDLRMRHEALELIEDAGKVTGLRVASPEGELRIRAGLVVACDGRNSTLRQSAELHAEELGAPMDALWFRLPRDGNEPQETFAIVGAGQILVLLNRNDYWQAAYVVAKGSDRQLRTQPVAVLRKNVAGLADFLADNVSAVKAWDDVKTLEVRVDRLQQWYRPGLLLIGDAAHAMSPIGGVGINLAIQDAVAAANLLAEPLREGGQIDLAVLRQIQERRLSPTRRIQALQLQIQNRVISRALNQEELPKIPWILRWLLKFRIIRNIPARVIGYGFNRERVQV